MAAAAPPQAPPHIMDLPGAVTHRILTGWADDLVRHAACCARVHPAWRRLLGESCAAYAAGTPEPLRSRLLRVLSSALAGLRRRGGYLHDLTLHLYGGEPAGRDPARGALVPKIGDQGAAALGAALASLPATRRRLFVHLELYNAGLTADGMERLAPGIASGFEAGRLKHIDVGRNGLGDAGVRFLSRALPRTVEILSVMATGCGNAGMAALSAALGGTPASVLGELDCGANPQITQAGWAAFGSALPHLRALKKLDAIFCTGMGCDGAASIAAGLSGTALEQLHLGDCGIGNSGAAALAAALAPPQLPSLQQLDLTDNGGIEDGGDAYMTLKGLEAARTAVPRGTNSPAAFVMWLP